MCITYNSEQSERKIGLAIDFSNIFCATLGAETVKGTHVRIVSLGSTSATQLMHADGYRLSVAALRCGEAVQMHCQFVAMHCQFVAMHCQLHCLYFRIRKQKLCQ